MDFEGDGGFQGYRKLLHTNSGISGSTFVQETQAPEISMEPPAQTNQTINSTSFGKDNECSVREQDRFLPIANVVKLMRKILPAHAKISDSSKETIQECVSEFIAFVTSEANVRCQQEQRKTITAEDILWAMSKLGFDDYIEPLARYLYRFRENEDGVRDSSRSEPSPERAADPVNYNILTSAPAAVAHHSGFFSPVPAPSFASAFVDQYPGFFAPAPGPMNELFNDPSGAGPSEMAEAYRDPFCQGKK